MINRALRRLDWTDAQAVLEAGAGEGVFVCEANEEEWRAYVASESQALRSRAMQWRPAEEPVARPADLRRGHVFIVEPPRGRHEGLVYRLGLAIADAAVTADEHLAGYSGTCTEDDFHEPDLCYRPDDRIGAVKPHHLRWNEFHTLKVEISISRDWNLLERKAKHWSTVGGVEYILVVHVSPGLQVGEYTVDEVSRSTAMNPTLLGVGQRRASIQRPPEATTIQLSARRLLALPDAVEMPSGFCGGQPTMEINLSAVVERAIARASY